MRQKPTPETFKRILLAIKGYEECALCGKTKKRGEMLYCSYCLYYFCPTCFLEHEDVSKGRHKDEEEGET